MKDENLLNTNLAICPLQLQAVIDENVPTYEIVVSDSELIGMPLLIRNGWERFEEFANIHNIEYTINRDAQTLSTRYTMRRKIP